MSRVRPTDGSAEGVPFGRTRRWLVSATILSAASLAIAACGSGDDGAETVDRQGSSSQSNTQSSTQNGQSSNQSNSQSSTQNGGASLSQSSFSTDQGTVRTFAGTDDAKVTVDVDGAARLLWSNDKGRRFRLSGAGGAAIDSRAGSGEVALPAGQHRLEVHGDVWTIVIRPG
jgi:hypothetical protein